MGVTLIVAKSFSSQRQALQGALRVGRYQDPAKRVLLKGVPLVDRDAELQYKSKLLKFQSSLKAKPVAAAKPTTKPAAKKRAQ
jgi:hypothetical protein